MPSRSSSNGVSNGPVGPRAIIHVTQSSSEQKQYIVYTVALYYCFITVVSMHSELWITSCFQQYPFSKQGICSSIFNPTLIELSHVFNTDLERISMIFPVRSIGCLLGTFVSKFVVILFP